MYYVVKNGPNIHLGVDANGAVETIATFTNGPTLKVRDLAILADEMVAVLNRDLVNRMNDIAATPENIATAHLPGVPTPEMVDEMKKIADSTWATDETGLPVLETAGEIKEFPDVTEFEKRADEAMDDFDKKVDPDYHPTDEDLGLEDVGP